MRFSRRGRGGQPSSFPRIFFLALFFLGGVFLGQFFASRLPDAVGQELADYLHQYTLLESEGSLRTVLSTTILYLRYPLLAVLLGFSSVGLFLIPCITVLLGFSVSFSVSCFTAVFGTGGIWLAFAALGFRCAITLPCYLLLAGSAWGNAAGLAALSFGRGRRVSPVVYGRSWWMRVLACMAVLLLGVCVDLLIAPRCLQWVLDQILM